MFQRSLVVVVLSVVACAKPHPVSTVRMGGVFPARPANCPLELRMEALSYELTSTYDTVGAIMVRGESGEAANAPRILALLKPDACTLGGEVVLVNTSANIQQVNRSGSPSGEKSSSHSYLVLRKKSEQPAPVQTF